jgi:DNA-binding response OmpR family regulator
MGGEPMENKPSARILIVDDDDGIRTQLTRILQLEGYTVDNAGTGHEGLKLMDANYYNLLLLDIWLPDMKGTDILAKVKDTTPKTLRVMITGSPSVETAVDAVNKLADGYILKPFDIDKVLERIRSLLEHQSRDLWMTEDKVAGYILSRAKEQLASKREEESGGSVSSGG